MLLTVQSLTSAITLVAKRATLAARARNFIVGSDERKGVKIY